MRKTILSMSWLVLSVAAAAAVAVPLAGCKDENKIVATQPSSTPEAAAPSASSTATASASAAPVGAKEKMAHCPNAVTGANTVIADVPGGIEITITSNDAAAMADIRARTQVLVDAAKNPDAQSKHTGGGGGGGVYGRCPVVMHQTSVDAKDVEGGTKVTVKAKNADEVDFVRREARERQTAILPSTMGAGERKMSHCPSAVDGATTKLTNNKDGVIVLVTAKDDSGMKDIRARAKHVVDVTKLDAAASTHTGEGTGGGGLGRCPVVVKDTVITAKDAPGGTEFTVKPKKPADVAALQKEAKDRAEKFMVPGAASAAPSGSARAPAPSNKPTPASTIQ